MENLNYLGMFSFGAFVGGIINYGLLKIDSTNSFLKVSAAIFGCAFSGSVFFFIQYLNNINPKEDCKNDSIYMYPLGLLIALLWLQVISTIEKRLISNNKYEKSLAILHITFLSLITLYITIKLLILVS